MSWILAEAETFKNHVYETMVFERTYTQSGQNQFWSYGPWSKSDRWLSLAAGTYDWLFQKQNIENMSIAWLKQLGT